MYLSEKKKVRDAKFIVCDTIYRCRESVREYNAGTRIIGVISLVLLAYLRVSLRRCH